MGRPSRMRRCRAAVSPRRCRPTNAVASPERGGPRSVGPVRAADHARPRPNGHDRPHRVNGCSCRFVDDDAHPPVRAGSRQVRSTLASSGATVVTDSRASVDHGTPARRRRAAAPRRDDRPVVSVTTVERPRQCHDAQCATDARPCKAALWHAVAVAVAAASLSPLPLPSKPTTPSSCCSPMAAPKCASALRRPRQRTCSTHDRLAASDSSFDMAEIEPGETHPHR